MLLLLRLFITASVKPLNKAVVLDLGDKNRTTLAQTFQAVRGNKTFTVIPNHLKSKGCSGVDANSSDADQNDGQDAGIQPA